MISKRNAIWSWAGMVLALVLLSGCGDGRPPMTNVTGTVTYKNAPLKFGAVFFDPVSNDALYVPRGVIKSDGTFEMETQNWKGAPLGEYRIRVNCFESQDPNFRQKEGGEPVRGKSLIPPKYSQSQKSGLTVTVTKGMAPLELKLED
ncbi:MAG: hypothetical protein Q4D62_15685 [Planctomycetia bacterium]|nr:hypothetical protein [Planctomycetia bacterium]